ncbi:MAG: TetR/AcrR family transcriptional regulator [Oscillospiraceae bacterium]
MTSEEIRLRNIDKVIEQTLNYFFLLGIDNTTVTMVAKACGLTARSIYRYFPQKADLVLATMSHFLEHSFTPLNEKLIQVDSTLAKGLERIEMYINAEFEFFEQKPAVLILLFEAELYFYRSKKDPLDLAKKVTTLQRLHNSWGEALKSGMQDGTVRKDIDVEQFVETFSLMNNGFLQRMVINYGGSKSEKPISIAENLDNYKAFVVSYLKP